jgi:predicted DNA-binding ribbon-helix-helix protein
MSEVKKRSITLGRRKTSISLEDEFWAAVHEIAQARNITLSALVGNLQRDGNLSSAIRLMVLEHYRNRATARTE